MRTTLLTLTILLALTGCGGGSTAAPKAATQDPQVNAAACKEFDDALPMLHQALTTTVRAPVSVALGAREAQAKIPAAAQLAYGPTRLAMERVGTFAQILLAKEGEMMRAHFTDATEVAGIQSAYAVVQPLCADAGIPLINTLSY
jgi:hypothetical protein